MNRIVEILIGEDWVESAMCGLEIDDVFRMWEANGEPAHGGKMWMVTAEPYFIDGTWGVSCEPIQGVISTL